MKLYDAFLRQLIKQSLVQVMAWYMFRLDPSFETNHYKITLVLARMVILDLHHKS